MKYKYNGQWYDLTVFAFDSLPVGTIVAYAGPVLPNGYLRCDGSQYSKTEYVDLYAKIGDRYNLSGDSDNTKFRVPNIQGRVPVGLDATQTEFVTLGETGGSKTDDLSNAYAKIGARAEGYMTYTEVGGKPSYTTNYMLVGSRGQGSDLAQTYGTELGGSISTLQPYIVVNYIIKAHPSAVNTSEVVNEHSTSETDVYSANYVNNNFQTKGTLLWTNSSPTSSFNSQIINIDLTAYDLIEIFYTRFQGINNFSERISFNGSTTYTQLTYSDYENNSVRAWNRNVEISNTSVGFNICTINGTTTNTGLIPYAIVGYKTGLFK